MATREARLRANRRHYQKHRARILEYEAEYRKRPEVKDRLKYWYLLRSYGLTREDYASIIASQGWNCPVCGEPLPANPKLCHVDHDHRCCNRFGSCGKCIRGVLCQNCNHGLGSFKDNVDFLEGAIRYLKTFAGKIYAGPPAT